MSAPVFQDPASQDLLRQATALATADQHILLCGPSGAGRQRMARYIHGLSHHNGHPFLAVNCAAYSEAQLRQGLHGHERGAIKGGFAARPGWFEMAQQGTLFLGEIDTLSLTLQDALLDVLRTGQVSRLGSGHRHTPVTVRIMASSTTDLAEAVSRGAFRRELRALFIAQPLLLPPLAARPGDILPLAVHVLAQAQRRMNYPPTHLDAAAQAALNRHAWPGNILELENVLHHAMRVSGGGLIGIAHLPPALRGAARSAARPSPGQDSPGDDERAVKLEQLEQLLGELCEHRPGTLFEDVERALVRAAHAHAGRNQIQAARLLGVSRNVLRGRLIAYGEIDALK